MSVSDWKLLGKKVLGVIQLTLTRSVAHNVTVGKKTTTELITALFRI